MYYVKMKGQDTLLLAIIGIIAGIAFVGGVAYGENNYKIFSRGVSTVAKADEKIVPAGYGSQLDTLGYDEYNIIYDENAYTYSLALDSYAGLNDSYYDVKYGQEKNTIILSKYFLADGKTENHQLSFDKPVVDSFVASFGENNDKDSIFFILEDGSIEYILMGRAMKNDDYRTFKINDLKNIAKHYNANACSDENNACVRTVLVQAMDGTIYNLANYIQ